jgi:hypothetical protein
MPTGLWVVLVIIAVLIAAKVFIFPGRVQFGGSRHDD